MTIKKGNKVKVEYEGKFEDGEVFDSSSHGDHSHPLEFVVGEGQVIRGFDDAVIGMEEGEEKKFVIEPQEAYGERKEELQQKVPKKALPKGQEPKKGMTILVGSPDGRRMPVKIINVDEKSITIFIKEVKCSPKFKNQPSFLSSSSQ